MAFDLETGNIRGTCDLCGREVPLEERVYRIGTPRLVTFKDGVEVEVEGEVPGSDRFPMDSSDRFPMDICESCCKKQFPYAPRWTKEGA